MKPEKILVSSRNPGKIGELKELLSPLAINVISAVDLNLADVEETGTTFHENALLKAVYGAETTGLATLADDSGLCVDALNGAPGVFTARYGGYEKLLIEMAKTHTESRMAAFHCCLCFVPKPGAEPLYFEGISKGKIANEPCGQGGFGYDPVFIPEGYTKTYAQMPAEEKAKTSHRARALQLFIEHLSN